MDAPRTDPDAEVVASGAEDDVLSSVVVGAVSVAGNCDAFGGRVH